MEIKPQGKARNLGLKTEPCSGWEEIGKFLDWERKLPNSYTYRLRAVDSTGKPLKIPRCTKEDDTGILYIGETGIKKNELSKRGAKLARGIVDRKVGSKDTAHVGAKKFWSENWDSKLRVIDQNYSIQFGWDPYETLIIPANKDDRVSSSKQNDEMIKNTGKGYALNREKQLLVQYKSNYGELPPLNSAKSPGLKDRDRKSKRDVSQDTHLRNDGIVDL